MDVIKIESRENKKIKDLNKLKLKKYRYQQREFLVENWKIIQDAKEGGIFPKSLFATDNFLKRNESLVKDIIDKGNLNEIFVISDKLIRNVSSLKNPEGIWGAYALLEEKIDYSNDVIYLNGVNDPGNLGTIIRSALAFGLNNIVLDEDCVDIYNSKTIQAAKESLFKLNISFDKNKKIIQEIKDNNFDIYITNVDKGKSINNLFSAENKKCIILGNESRGVSAELNKEANEFINIKTTSRIESLNVAISAGIIFYELFKNSRK